MMRRRRGCFTLDSESVLPVDWHATQGGGEAEGVEVDLKDGEIAALAGTAAVATVLVTPPAVAWMVLPQRGLSFGVWRANRSLYEMATSPGAMAQPQAPIPPAWQVSSPCSVALLHDTSVT